VPERHAIRQLLDHLFKRLEPQFLAEGVSFTAEHQVLSLDVAVSVDRQIMENLLRHVVANAADYTAKGKITVTAYTDQGRLWIEVQDTGRGISPSDMAQVFEPFFRGTEICRRDRQHLGLGLAIIQKYAELSGIGIELHSRLNEGTRFLIRVGKVEAEITESKAIKDAVAG
jgi:signal transduction histidine kinase